MKKLSAVLLLITLVFSLASCSLFENIPDWRTSPGNTDKPDVPKPSAQTSDLCWPAIYYLKDSDKYTGDGKITQVKEWDASGDNEMWSIYFNNATFESVESYVADLVAAGWTNHYADEDGNYMENITEDGTARAYYCTCEYACLDIQIADFANSMSFSDKAEFSFNLEFEFTKS